MIVQVSRARRHEETNMYPATPLTLTTASMEKRKTKEMSEDICVVSAARRDMRSPVACELKNDSSWCSRLPKSRSFRVLITLCCTTTKSCQLAKSRRASRVPHARRPTTALFTRPPARARTAGSAEPWSMDAPIPSETKCGIAREKGRRTSRARQPDETQAECSRARPSRLRTCFLAVPATGAGSPSPPSAAPAAVTPTRNSSTSGPVPARPEATPRSASRPRSARREHRSSANERSAAATAAQKTSRPRAWAASGGSSSSRQSTFTLQNAMPTEGRSSAARARRKSHQDRCKAKLARASAGPRRAEQVPKTATSPRSARKS
mmetsp:Transcript_89461/g.266858  ORF Transcript_89461/g.266858 Transcript_89461/m.266858 type:complete len:322 (-) Transcript_89461:201-1166(-)